ncbi:SDR family NAD(P)-dependent oxidoreductase [Streptacidiphilus jiangxiensis]|uniref:NAD(P)-dependent dehydrogenase, short-chain alcohol dehydrogenase family n=1 Tax=Streptacidiphilus jiangxiensis TaxID=235985 RepID=A0A1H7X0W2_STRJI|nr:SDR family oxidoreductase [Streptacidiphilus jiangxiensis]SEM27194.1 NAD(P)-dependent dehydrogenase, short-chain alcohol dehydrogenase family [Streptacidiphilus jiangxiensis]
MTDQRVTVVTGASRGIGAAVALRLAREGHDLVLGYRSDEEAARQVAEQVRAQGRRCVTVQADTTDQSDVERLFGAAAEAGLGPVTGLVNNAGVPGPYGPLAEADPEGIRRSVDVNVTGYLLCARAAVRAMTETGVAGSIVNISSGAATLGSPGEYVHYAAAKAAVDAMTVGLAKELGPRGIRVNCVAPGTVWTDFHPDPERPAKRAPNIPLGRCAQPEEIAGAVAWFFSPDASYATGAVLRVAGGM